MTPTEYLETPRAMPDHEAMDECSAWAVSLFARTAGQISTARILPISAGDEGQSVAQVPVGKVL